MGSLSFCFSSEVHSESKVCSYGLNCPSGSPRWSGMPGTVQHREGFALLVATGFWLLHEEEQGLETDLTFPQLARTAFSRKGGGGSFWCLLCGG